MVNQMSRGPQTFKQRDVARVLRATAASGVGVDRVEISKDGKIVVFPARATAGQPTDEQPAEPKKAVIL